MLQNASRLYVVPPPTTEQIARTTDLESREYCWRVRRVDGFVSALKIADAAKLLARELPASEFPSRLDIAAALLGDEVLFTPEYIFTSNPLAAIVIVRRPDLATIASVRGGGQ